MADYIAFGTKVKSKSRDFEGTVIGFQAFQAGNVQYFVEKRNEDGTAAMSVWLVADDIEIVPDA